MFSIRTYTWKTPSQIWIRFALIFSYISVAPKRFPGSGSAACFQALPLFPSAPGGQRCFTGTDALGDS